MDINPDLREEIREGRKVAMTPRLRMFKGYMQRVANYIKLERYEEAALLMGQFRGICNAWSFKQQMDRSFAEKAEKK